MSRAGSPTGRPWRGLVPLLFCLLVAFPSFGAILAQWNFNSSIPDANAATGTVAPATGLGTASLVGNVTATFTAPNGSSDPDAGDNSNWRITTWPPQATQNKQNGVQFKVNSAGYRSLALRWDLRNSNTASKYIRLQYSTNGTDFLDFQVIVMPSETWINGQSTSFVGVPGVDDNPRFAVRFVTEFETTATGSGVVGYVPSNPGSTYGNAGTLRFDMVTFTGEPTVTALSVLSYNILGNGATNWTLGGDNLQAIGRELNHLGPDVIGLQEIPETFYLQMTNFIGAWLPGYELVIGQRTEGGERSGIASRFPVARFKSWLARSNLTAFGYSGVFTRDLFEAELRVPGFAQPFHFFTTHLKAHPDEDSSIRRGAESRAISNYFANGFLPTNSLHPYLLLGDMNEDVNRPRTYEQQAIQTLTSQPTGLRLTTPRNPVTNDERTWSIQNASLTIRFDYVLPCTLLYSNLVASQVFRSDKVIPAAPPLQAGDSAVASDHLPIHMVFRNPYSSPYAIQGLSLSNEVIVLQWQSVPGGRYRIERATNWNDWTPSVTNLTATAYETKIPLTLAPTFEYLRVARED